MEVTVHKVSEQLGTPKVRDNDSCVGIGEQMHGKPGGLNSEDGLERNV